MTYTKALFTSVLMISFIAITSGQKFSYSISSDSILVGNYFELSFKLENLDASFEAPNFDSIPVLSGPNMASSMQVINGDMSSSKSYSYYLKPKDIGLYTISPAYAVAQDSTYETEPIYINVFPNPDNVIEEPKRKSNMFSFDWPTIPTQPKVPSPPTAPTKPKRKLKRI